MSTHASVKEPAGEPLVGHPRTPPAADLIASDNGFDPAQIVTAFRASLDEFVFHRPPKRVHSRIAVPVAPHAASAEAGLDLDDEDLPPSKRLRPRPVTIADVEDREPDSAGEDEDTLIGTRPRPGPRTAAAAGFAEADSDNEDGELDSAGEDDMDEEERGAYRRFLCRVVARLSFPQEKLFNTAAKPAQIMQQVGQLLPGLGKYRNALDAFRLSVRAHIASHVVTPTPSQVEDPTSWPSLGNSVDSFWEQSRKGEPTPAASGCPGVFSDKGRDNKTTSVSRSACSSRCASARGNQYYVCFSVAHIVNSRCNSGVVQG
jgi:hypothetical protein